MIQVLAGEQYRLLAIHDYVFQGVRRRSQKNSAEKIKHRLAVTYREF